MVAVFSRNEFSEMVSDILGVPFVLANDIPTQVTVDLDLLEEEGLDLLCEVNDLISEVEDGTRDHVQLAAETIVLYFYEEMDETFPTDFLLTD